MPRLHPAEDDAPSTRAAAWFVRLRAEDCRQDERVEFARWLEADPAHRREFAAMETLWHELDRLSAPEPVRGPRPRVTWAAAASVVLAVTVTAYVMLPPKVETTAKGEQRAVTLADGTRVHLNSDTVLAVEFSADSRRVELRRGEALFDVATETGRPFQVVAGDTTIRDIGTRFDVRRREDRITVAVTDGRVEIANAHATRCGVDAGFSAVVSAAGECAVASLDSTSLAWTEGRLLFDGTPLRDVAEEFNRYQTRPLRLADERTGALRLSGAFRIDHLGNLPLLLQRTLPVTLETAEDGAWVLRSTM